jgi:hypothetical protein
MKTTITKSSFIDAFRTMGRFDQFGYDALELLFDYFEDMEADTGEEMELDVIAICCDYAVDTVEDIAEAYNVEPDDVMDYLQDNSTVVGECADGRVVYCSAF